MPLPPKDEQKQIAQEIERRLAAVGKLTATLNLQLERAKATRQLLLHEAFTGNLAPQDLTDEPASTLLERIRAAHDAEAKRPKIKRMPNTKLTFVTWKLFDLIKDKFGNRTFTFDALRKEIPVIDYAYDDLRNDLFEMLRPGVSGAEAVLQMSFDVKKEAIEFKLRHL